MTPNALTIRRPYPVDEIRQTRVHMAMRRLGMTNRELAHLANLQEKNLNNLTSGRWRSREAEVRVAYILDQDVDYLFPLRTRDELVAMAQAAAEEKAAVERRRAANMARLGVAV